MRKDVTWLMATLAALPACGSSNDGNDGNDGQGPPTTITINAGVAPDLVAFRNESDPTWQVATMVGTNQYSIVVHGPYLVSVACHGVPFPDALVHELTQYARTLSDPTTIDDATCDYDQTGIGAIRVDGALAQRGALSFGTTPVTNVSSKTFSVNVDEGSYTIYAVSASHYLAQRDVSIAANITLPTIDIDANGAPLIPTAFKVSNPAMGKVPQAAVLVEDFAKFGDVPSLYVYTGDAATAKVVPTSALAAGELQTVSVREITLTDYGETARAARRAFKTGDSTELTLPDPIDGLTWSTVGNTFSARWKSLPDDMSFTFRVSGSSISHDQSNHYTINASASFLSITGTDQVTAENNLPGYDPQWAIDTTAQQYHLDAIGQRAGNLMTDPVISVWDTRPVAPANGQM